MLETQKLLLEQGIQALEPLGITVRQHPTDPLIILNYDQIESPKSHPVVHECRGLVLHSETFEIVAKAFNRFFNYGEVVGDYLWGTDFDLSKSTCLEKVDGSLILVYYFDGKWRVNTRNSFGDMPIYDGGPTWSDVVSGVINKTCELHGFGNDWSKLLSTKHTWVFELCSPYNQVVKQFAEPKLCLIGLFRDGVEEEITEYDWDDYTYEVGFDVPYRYEFPSIDAAIAWLDINSVQDPTFEGFVFKGVNGERAKVKSKKYLQLHRLKGNGNIFLKKNLVPFVLSGEADELFSIFPAVKPIYQQVEMEIQPLYDSMITLWECNKDVESQKEFALAVKNHPFSAILFNARKHKTRPQRLWKDACDLIIKKMDY